MTRVRTRTPTCLPRALKNPAAIAAVASANWYNAMNGITDETSETTAFGGEKHELLLVIVCVEGQSYLDHH